MLSERLHIAWKYFASFFRRDWQARDYPLRYRHFPVAADQESGRLTPVAWSVQVLGWPTMQGHGETTNEALANLELALATRRERDGKLPRPGTAVPIEFASTSRIDMYPHLVRDFLERILDLNYDECFISDGSSLWEFHAEENNDAINDKVLITYGVDISDIESANLADIFARLVEHGAPA